MCQLPVANVEERDIISKAKNTVHYLFDAICQEDFESAQLELSELNFVIKRLADIQKKRERRELLVAIVADMQKRGINIDFAQRASFLKIAAKNAVEINQKYSKIHKKRQQA
ncbi:hypothetical protein ABE096_12385 [Robertmurraya massiliosenegalensis]|uniref:hypothetical protein n=1 Tax=Robertmurraya TaxID=2837507 RepID=UPI0039A558C3